MQARRFLYIHDKSKNFYNKYNNYHRHTLINQHAQHHQHHTKNHRTLYTYSTKTNLSIRIATYNILSPNLCTQEYYPTYPKEHIEPKKRLVKILSKLSQEIKTSKPLPVIFCLQEVSREWSNHLTVFFSSKEYHFITGLYGGKKNGYMGVCIAYPMSVFRLIKVDNFRLSDVCVGGSCQLCCFFIAPPGYYCYGCYY